MKFGLARGSSKHVVINTDGPRQLISVWGGWIGSNGRRSCTTTHGVMERFGSDSSLVEAALAG